MPSLTIVSALLAVVAFVLGLVGAVSIGFAVILWLIGICGIFTSSLLEPPAPEGQRGLGYKPGTPGEGGGWGGAHGKLP